MEDIRLLLSYIETEIKEGKKPLIGSGVIVNGGQILDLLNRIRRSFDEATGENKVKEATEKAKEIIEYAQESKRKLMDEDAAMQEARLKAERIIQQALVEKNRKENDLKQNLSFLLATVKETVENAEKSLQTVLDEANKSLDSAINRVNKATLKD